MRRHPKMLIVAAVAVAALAGCTSQPSGTPSGGPAKPNFSWKVPTAQLPASDYKVLVVGASNTEGSQTLRDTSTRWHDLVAGRLAANRATSVTRVRYNGETTGSGSLLHLDQGYSGVSAVALSTYPEIMAPVDADPDEFWVLLGTNDEGAKFSPEKYRVALDKIVKRWAPYSARCVVVAPWENGNFGFYVDRAPHEQYLVAARTVAEANGCVYAKQDEIGSANSSLGIGDGVHMSTAGHQALANLLISKLGL